LWQKRGDRLVARNDSVFRHLEEVKSWSWRECGRKLRSWAPDLKLTGQISGLVLLSMEPSQLGLLWEVISFSDVSRLHVLLHSDTLAGKTQKHTFDIDVRLQKRGFAEQYIDRHNQVNDFVEYVRQCSKCYMDNPQLWLSPYITVVQSSGYGKSRLLLEASRHIRTMYICMRAEPGASKGTSGYPRRSSRAIDALMSGLEEEDAEKYSENLAKRIELCRQSAIVNLPRPAQKLDDPSRFQSEFHSGKVWNLDAIPSCSQSAKKELVLIVFDEARVTLAKEIEGISQFRLIRRALWQCHNHSKCPIFAVFIDTLSKIQNFSPSADRYPSLRSHLMAKEKSRCDLFRPWIVRGSFDALFLPMSRETQDLEVLVKCTNYLKAGRPLLHLEARSPGIGDEDLNFLSRKLRGGSDDWTLEGALGHILCRLAAYVFPQHPFATQMVSEHMATLLATSAERMASLVSYIAEPRLAMAAAVQWNLPAILAQKFIPALQRALVGGALDHGSRGELVAQIVILCAFDKACKQSDKFAGEAVVLRSVLEQLLPADVDSKLLENLPKDLLDSHVACCQFVNLCQRFGNAEVVALAERHCGASFRDKQCGLDLVVPIMADIWGLLLFQVKNISSDETIRSVVYRKLDANVAFAKDKFSEVQRKSLNSRSVFVILQLGAKDFRAKVKYTKSLKVLEIFGLGARCLSDDVQAALGVVLNGHIQLEDFILNDGYDRDEQHDYGPNPNSLGKIRQIWPFLTEPNPTLDDLKREISTVPQAQSEGHDEKQTR
jgi:hypothetical protein